MNINKVLIFFLVFNIMYLPVFAQVNHLYNLNQLLKANKLSIAQGKIANEITDGSKPGISCNGIVWLKNCKFNSGEIDVDLRGRNVFQQSFLGIAFHGVDTTNYEAIYFRPFNFQSNEAIKREHTVQYVSEPNFPWDRLRQQHPLVYENAVIPQPSPTNWFHAHIVINKNNIIVCIDHSTKPSLKVKKLNNRNIGLIGLWTYGLSGDFANLTIKY